MASDTTPAPAGWRSWVAPILLVVVGAATAVYPYLPVLHQFPCGPDTIFWTRNMDPAQEGWWHAVFLERHYVAYRPVTALTFSLNAALTGANPWWLQAVDVALHALVGLGVYGVFGALARRSGSSWAVLAATSFWISPLNESVVPFVARRSYSLATVFGLAAVVATVHGVRGGRGALTGLGAVMLFLAVLSNETAYVVAPVLVLAAALWAPTWRAAVAHATPTVALGVLAVGFRWAVLEGLGGYQKPLVAVVEDGQRHMVLGAQPWQVFGWAWTAAAAPETPSGDPTFLTATSAGLAGSLALALWAVGWSAHRALRARDPVPLLLMTWAVGYAALAAVSGTWFLRMAYAMGAPVALWLVWVVRESLPPGRGRWNLAPLAVILAARAQNATPVRGLDREPIREQFVSTRAIRRAVAALDDIEGPALVWAGMNLRASTIPSTLHWIREQAPPDVEIRQLTRLIVDEKPSIRATVAFGSDTLAPTEDAVWAPPVRDATWASPRQPVPLAALRIDDRPTWVLDEGVLTRIEPPELP